MKEKEKKAPLLKGKTGFSLKLIALISVVLFTVLVAVRLYHTFFNIDGATGYFIKNDFTVLPMYILTVLGVILVCAFCYVSGDTDRGKTVGKASFIGAVTGILFGLSVVYEGAVNLFDGIRAIPSHVIPGGRVSLSVLTEAFGGRIELLATVFAILGGIVILAEGVISASGREIPSFMKLPMLIPVLWAFLETLTFFSVTVSYLEVSQMFFEIFSRAFLMVFLFEHARVVSGIGKKDSSWFFFASGILAAGFLFMAGVPYFLASLFATDKIVSYCPFEFYVLAGGLYAVATVIKRSGREEAEAEIPVKPLNTEDVTETL